MGFLKNLSQKTRGVYFYISKVLTILICLFIIKASRLVEVMLWSRNVYYRILLISHLCHAAFFCIWIYVSFAIQPMHKNWPETHKHLIYSATAAVVAGGVFWIIAVWPVFHIWTLPLGIVNLLLFFNVIALMSSRPFKLKR